MTRSTNSVRIDRGSPGVGFIRQTRQRSIITAHVNASPDFHTAGQIHARLRAEGETVGLSTVYRFLQSLADRGELDVVHLADGEAAYRRCSSYHHHLVCRSYGHAVEVAGPAVERWANRIADEHGYRDVQHDVEIYGLCRNCPDNETHSR